MNRLEKMAQNQMTQNEEVYIMEKILDKRISSSGKLEYLIAWENFGPEDNTWEPESNIFCPVMLKNFEEKKAAEKRSKKNGRNRKDNENYRMSSGGPSVKSVDQKPADHKENLFKMQETTIASMEKRKGDEENEGKSKKKAKLGNGLSMQKDDLFDAHNFDIEIDVDTSLIGIPNPGAAGAMAPPISLKPTSSERAPVAKRSLTRKSPKKSTHQSNENQELQGFDRGLAPKKIFGATKKYGDLMFLMKWQGSGDSFDLVLASEANVKCPQIVINFYEDRLTFCSSTKDKKK